MQTLLDEQDGVVLTRQATACGLTPRQIRTLAESGWRHSIHGVLVQPHAADPFRASVRAALLSCPNSVTHGLTAGRLHRLWGLPLWTPDERPELILPRGKTFNTRKGLILHKGLRENEEWVDIDGFPTVDLERTICQLAMILPGDDLVCAVDSARRKGWVPFGDPLRPRRKLHRAIALSDPRSESALETLGRLLLGRAGMPPETLQYELFDATANVYVRFDAAWPSARVAAEFDGKEFHADLRAMHRDRVKSNAAANNLWRLYRFTWFDVTSRPEYVIATLREALGRG